MRAALPCVAALLALNLAIPLVAADPARVDPAERNDRFSPAQATRPQANPPPDANRLVDQRLIPPVQDKSRAAASERPAPVTVEESRAKATRVPAATARPPAVHTPQTNPWSGRRAEAQTGLGGDDKPVLVPRYQERMAAARAAASEVQPTIEGGATFESLNRFVFRRNRPEGGAEGEAPATPAGGGVGRKR